MTEGERVWTRMKNTAEKLAMLGITDIGRKRAEALIWRIVRDEQAEDPPEEALAYLAGELCSLLSRQANRASRH